MDKYECRINSADKNEPQEKLIKAEASATPRTKRTKGQKEWIADLTPCLNKLLNAAQGVVKTLRISHGIQRLKEELPRSATAHTLQHRRDVCFSQAVRTYDQQIFPFRMLKIIIIS